MHIHMEQPLERSVSIKLLYMHSFYELFYSVYPVKGTQALPMHPSQLRLGSFSLLRGEGSELIYGVLRKKKGALGRGLKKLWKYQVVLWCSVSLYFLVVPGAWKHRFWRSFKGSWRLKKCENCRWDLLLLGDSPVLLLSFIMSKSSCPVVQEQPRTFSRMLIPVSTLPPTKQQTNVSLPSNAKQSTS